MTEEFFLKILKKKWNTLKNKPLKDVFTFYQNDIIQLVNKKYNSRFIKEYLELKIQEKISMRSIQYHLKQLDMKAFSESQKTVITNNNENPEKDIDESDKLFEQYLENKNKPTQKKNIFDL